MNFGASGFCLLSALGIGCGKLEICGSKLAKIFLTCGDGSWVVAEVSPTATHVDKDLELASSFDIGMRSEMCMSDWDFWSNLGIKNKKNLRLKKWPNQQDQPAFLVRRWNVTF